MDESLDKPWYPLFDPDDISSNEYFSIDSGGFYWVSKEHRNSRQEAWKTSINRVCDQGLNNESIGRCSILVNGGGNQYYERQGYTRYVYLYLSDMLKTSEIETISVRRGNREINVIVDYARQSRSLKV
ncbi:hypothetical protein [Photorhabdus cinerea]|uniref:Uncharacterized protein n=1 Tax=Photorhabdus cinerea TaxID=471575 RepID=A0A7X5TIQ8_9GAMM|nr:hypothetical protein [Photorhabdus cinerea]NHB93828.1 hypothetical protein [Photorhabdus cinerea]